MICIDRLGHLISDSCVDELHRFAGRIGLRRVWFQDKPGRPHYDLTTADARRRAVAAGAVLVDPRDVVRILQKAPYQPYCPVKKRAR
jgi:hypothetical protein